MNHLISIIIPTYNTEQYVMRCVQSVTAQSYSNLEIILVDDGSQDGSPTISDELALEDHRIRVIHKANAGVSSARNTGLRLAIGSYVTFADSDDILHCKMIERLYRLLREHGADISSCDYTSSDAELGYCQGKTPIMFDALSGISDMLCNKNLSYSVCCKLFSRTTVNDLSFHTEYSHNEDLLFCYEAFIGCSRIVHMKEMLYLYFSNPNSATRTAFSHKRMTAIDVQERILRDVSDRFPGSPLLHTAIQQFLKVNIYTGIQMSEAGYSDNDDRLRIKTNVRQNLPALLTGSLALGYKANGLLLAFTSFVVRRRKQRKRL